MIAPKLRFSEFKDEWIEKNLESIADLTSSKRVHLSDYAPSGIPFFRGKEITELKAGKKPTDVLYISNEQFEQIKSKYGVPKNGEMLITAVGTLANSYLVNLDYDFYFKDGNLIWFKNITEVPEFLELLLDAKKNDVLNSSIGSTQRALTILNLNKLKFYFPSKEEQTKIAEFLSAVDDKISQLSRQLELLNQYKKGVMQKIFSQEIRFKNDNGEDFGEWEEIQLKDFLTLTLRPVDKPNENYHALGVRSHFKGLFNKYDSQPEKNSMDVLYEVFENDIVVNITFAWEGAMAIANKIHHKGLVSHRFPTYQTDESKILLNFFRYIFIQKDFLAELQLCSPGGAGRNRVLSKKDFLEISILKPSVQEQAKIAEFLTAIDERIDHTTAQLTHTKQWKKGLLQQMFV